MWQLQALVVHGGKPVDLWTVPLTGQRGAFHGQLDELPTAHPSDHNTTGTHHF